MDRHLPSGPLMQILPFNKGWKSFNLQFVCLIVMFVHYTRLLSSASMLTGLTGRHSMLMDEGVRLWPPVRYLTFPILNGHQYHPIPHIFKSGRAPKKVFGTIVVN